MFVSNMPRALTKSFWCLIISHTKAMSGLGCGSGIMNMYIFLCPAIYKGRLACFYICVFFKHSSAAGYISIHSNEISCFIF